MGRVKAGKWLSIREEHVTGLVLSVEEWGRGEGEDRVEYGAQLGIRNILDAWNFPRETICF